MNSVIIIPVRLGSTRLSKKPIINLNGLPMMIQVAKRALESKAGEVVIACGDQELVDLAHSHGLNAILTDPALPTGSDRVYQAYKLMNKDFDYVINLQGDMPFIAPHTIKVVCELLNSRPDIDISTAVCPINSEKEVSSPNVVKAVVAQNSNALYFTRAANAPYGQGEHYKHIGIYGFTSQALEKFVNSPRSPLEIRENIEALRALENDMKIAVSIVNDNVVSIDTPDDLKLLL